MILQLSSVQFTFYIASKGDDPPHKNIAARAKELEACVEGLYPCKCDVEFVGAKRLITLAQQSRRTPLVLDYTTDLSSGQMGDAYVCLVPVHSFATFLTAPDGEQAQYILQPNVRAYLGDRGINKQIKATLENENPADEFWWLNDGVTIVASNVKRSAKNYTLEDPRIVNGLQTSREIYNYSRSKGTFADERHVLVKIIETKDQPTVDQIIRATNSQTKIPKVYLHGTEEIHEGIGMAFPPFGLYYERLQNQWAEERIPRDKIVTLHYLMQALIAIYLQQPDQARGRPTQFAEKEYRQLFGRQHEPEFYANAARLMKEVEHFLKKREPPLEASEQLNFKFYMAMYAACLLTGSPRPGKRISDVDLSKKTDELFEDCFNAVEIEFVKASETRERDQVARGPDLTNFLKNAIGRRLNGRDAT